MNTSSSLIAKNGKKTKTNNLVYKKSSKSSNNSKNRCNHHHETAQHHHHNNNDNNNFNNKKHLKINNKFNGNNHHLFKDPTGRCRRKSSHNNSVKNSNSSTALIKSDKIDQNRSSSIVNSNDLIIGNFTREVYNAICLRLGDTLHIPEDSVKTLFNDMHLFPSDNQVTKMLQCARQYSRRNGPNPNYLTFGEFCVFLREMQNHSSSNNKSQRKTTAQQKLNNNKCPNNKCEVFLGGSCNPTTWRADTAIPELQKHGISFYNPQVSIWAPELLAQEHDAKQSASVLLFMIDSQTRSTVGMLEVAYLVACGRCVIVVAQPYRIGQSIMGEIISDREYHDLVQGQKSLLDLIKLKGVQIHTNLSTALQCTAEILKNVTLNGASPEELLTFKLKRLREVYESYNGQMRMSDLIDAYSRLTNRSLEISKFYSYLNLQQQNNEQGNGSSSTSLLGFEKFCAIMAELSTDGCGMCNIEGRDYIRPLFWSCALLKTKFLLRNMVLQSLAWASQTFTKSSSDSTKNPFSTSSSTTSSLNASTTASSHSNEFLYDIFLGGSLSTGIKWRENVAIPLIEPTGLKFYNPSLIRETELDRHSDVEVSKWQDLIAQSKIAIFVITNDTRSLTSMILAAHYIGMGKEVVLCVQQLNNDRCVVDNEMLTKIAIKDYNRARAYLKDLAERRDIPVFETVEHAVNCVIKKFNISSTKSTENEKRIRNG